jgi:hypothetical protein
MGSFTVAARTVGVQTGWSCLGAGCGDGGAAGGARVDVQVLFGIGLSVTALSNGSLWRLSLTALSLSLTALSNGSL